LGTSYPTIRACLFIVKQPSIYIIVLNWNRRDDTIACLESLVHLDYPNVQTVLVDNASLDDTVAVVQARFPKVKVILNLKNLGFAGGNNVGIQYALKQGADYLLLLNNDTEVAPDLLTHLLNGCDPKQRVSITIPKIYYHANPHYIWSAGAQWRQFPPRITMIGLNQPDSEIYNQPRLVEYATCCAMLIHHTVFDEVGLLDDSFFMYQEDYEFCYRVQQANFQIGYIPTGLVWHKVSQSTGEDSSTKWIYWGQSVVLLYQKLYHYYLLPLLSFLLWVMLRELFKGKWRFIKPLMYGVTTGLARKITI